MSDVGYKQSEATQWNTGQTKKNPESSMVGFEPGTNRLQVQRTLATESHFRQFRKKAIKDNKKKKKKK